MIDLIKRSKLFIQKKIMDKHLSNDLPLWLDNDEQWTENEIIYDDFMNKNEKMVCWVKNILKKFKRRC